MKKIPLIILALLLAAFALSTVPAMSRDSGYLTLTGKYVIGHAIQKSPFILVDTAGTGFRNCTSIMKGCGGCKTAAKPCMCKGMMRIVMVGGTILDPWTLNLRTSKYVAVEYKIVKGQRIATRVTQLEHSCRYCNK